jgi:3-oxoadipate enol-lactonase
LKDAALHYEFEGPKGAPVVVLSNSLGTELSLWESQIAGLTRHFRVLRYDTRGHGRSKSPGSAYSLDDLGGDVLDLLNFLEIERFHVCGVSLGGITALWLAINAPERVLSLMPCNTAARIGSESSWNARIEQVTEYGLASIADATMERWFTESFRRSDPVRVETARRMLLHTDAQGYIACCAALRDADLRDAVATIAVPALVVSGAHDPVTPPSDGQYLQDAIPSARYCELNAAHISNVEQSAAFSQAMLEFLGAL